MAQADGVVANGTGSAVRSDINNQYAALWSNHSGSTEPSSGKVAYQLWADTNSGYLKIRNAANNAWIQLFKLDGTDLANICRLTGSTDNTVCTVTGANAITGEAKLTFNGSGDLTVKGDESTSANLYLIADEGDDNGDGWRVGSNQDANDLTFANNISGSYVDKMTLENDGDLSVIGGVTLGNRNFETGTFSATGGSTGIKHNQWANNELGVSMSHQVTGGQSAFAFYNPNGLVGYIQTSASATIYSTSSDYRLKENEVPISDGITRLKQLKPYRFNFKKDPTKIVDGFFAHEAQTVVPEAVTGTKDEVATKDEGDRKVGDPIIQGIDQAKLVPLLTAALQEAITKIETLEIKVSALEAK
tara:strand:+ start:33 stop:1112 length:1080 start_codon:yes stop_codon:yes gene_type:complete